MIVSPSTQQASRSERTASSKPDLTPSSPRPSGINEKQWSRVLQATATVIEKNSDEVAKRQLQALKKNGSDRNANLNDSQIRNSLNHIIEKGGNSQSFAASMILFELEKASLQPGLKPRAR